MREMQSANEAAVYQIRVEGTVDTSWSDWFEGLAMTFERVGRGGRREPVGAAWTWEDDRH